jgi:hypothetical protein
MRAMTLLLLLSACATETENTLEVAGPPGVVRMSLTPLFAGLQGSLEIRDMAPGDSVFVGASVRGLGNGPCPPGYNDCVQIRSPYAFLDSFTANGNGLVDIDFQVPDNPGLTVCLQAAVPSLRFMLPPICDDVRALP